jgi:predicted dehydrogenase
MIKLGIIGQPLSVISHLQASGYMNEIIWTGFFSEKAGEPGRFFSLVPQFANAEQLISASDAIILSESRIEYYNLAVMALKQARHVFLPVTLLETVAEANKLIKLASESNVILNVYKSGILPADFRKRIDFKENIWLMELHHFARVTGGNPGKNLFMNLLHDLDFILGLTRSNVVSIKAAGLNMISNVVDIINARIDFDNGCTATLTCNCASVNDEHTGTVVLKDKIIYIDFIREDASIWNFNRSDRIRESIITNKISFHHDDDFGEELLSFFTLLNDKNRQLVNSEDGFRPFILATKIMDRVNRNTVRSA